MPYLITVGLIVYVVGGIILAERWEFRYPCPGEEECRFSTVSVIRGDKS